MQRMMLTCRHFLKANPPVRGPNGMSWEGFVKLEDALSQGVSTYLAAQTLVCTVLMCAHCNLIAHLPAYSCAVSAV